MINLFDLSNNFVHAVLPIAFDESLSYYEVLAKTTAKLNEVISEVNTLSDIISAIPDYSSIIASIEKSIAKINIGTSDTFASPIVESELFWQNHILKIATTDIDANAKINANNSRAISVEEWCSSLFNTLNNSLNDIANKANTANDKANAAATTAQSALDKANVLENTIQDEVALRSSLIEKNDEKTHVLGKLKYGVITEGNGFNNYVSLFDEDNNEYKLMVGTDQTDDKAGLIGSGTGVNPHSVIVFGDDTCGTNGFLDKTITALGNTWNVKKYAVDGAHMSSDGTLATSILNLISTAKETEGTAYCDKVGTVLIVTGINESGTTSDIVAAVATRAKQTFRNAKIVLCLTGTYTTEFDTIIPAALANGMGICDFFLNLSILAKSTLLESNKYVNVYDSFLTNSLVDYLNTGKSNASVNCDSILITSAINTYYQTSGALTVTISGNGVQMNALNSSFTSTSTPPFNGSFGRITNKMSQNISRKNFTGAPAILSVNYSDGTTKSFSGMIYLQNPRNALYTLFPHAEEDEKTCTSFTITFLSLPFGIFI